MSKQEKNIVKPALEYFYSFLEAHPNLFPFHDYKFINETISACKEIAKAEGLKKENLCKVFGVRFELQILF